MSIQVFEHENFAGASQTFPEGFFNLGDDDGYLYENIQNDSLTSFILDAYTRVSFYWHANGQGERIDCENHSAAPLRVGNVGPYWNDQISSMIVAALPRPVPPSFGESVPPVPPTVVAGLEGVRVFEDLNFQQGSTGALYGHLGARAQVFREGNYNLPHEPDLIRHGRLIGRRMGVRPHAIRSVQVGQGYVVELFEGPNQSGASLSLNQSTGDLRQVGGDGWQDRAQSLRVVRMPILR